MSTRSPSRKDTPLMPLEAMEEAAQCLRTLAHPARLRMVEMLASGERTVGELAEACGLQPHMASEHLSIMRDRGLLAAQRRGRCVYYAIGEEGLHGILACVRKRFGSED